VVLTVVALRAISHQIKRDTGRGKEEIESDIALVLEVAIGTLTNAPGPTEMMNVLRKNETTEATNPVHRKPRKKRTVTDKFKGHQSQSSRDTLSGINDGHTRKETLRIAARKLSGKLHFELLLNKIPLQHPPHQANIYLKVNYDFVSNKQLYCSHKASLLKEV